MTIINLSSSNLCNEQEEVLVAIVKTPSDLKIAQEEHWYRIPVKTVHKVLKNRFPPKFIAFYQPKIFQENAFSIHYYSEIKEITQAYRWELFPDAPKDAKSNELYCKLHLVSLQKLEKPIYSKRFRRVTFIPTTWQKFISAEEINDLWDESPLEDRLWQEFKRLNIDCKRQEYVKIKDQEYYLDFAVYCASGKINIETDGDNYHSSKEQIKKDLVRDNYLKTQGWRVLRFNTEQIQKKMREYCLPLIIKNINLLGGLKKEQKPSPIEITTYNQTKYLQLNLFDF